MAIVSYTYGQMPPYGVFKQQVRASTDEVISSGEAYAYPMQLVDEDEVGIAESVLMGLPDNAYTAEWAWTGGRVGTHKFHITIVGERNIYKFIKGLVRFADEADDTDLPEEADKARDLASSILSTLDIEWI